MAENLASMLEFTIGYLPFIYLGVPNFRARLKSNYFQFLDEKFKLQLLSWKATLLTMTDITQLVKSLVQRMLIHCLQVYDSPMKILKILKSWIRKLHLEWGYR